METESSEKIMSAASLLRQIADALDMDVEEFGYTSDNGLRGTRANEECEPGASNDLLRLIAAFQALSTREARLEALRFIEELAGSCENH